MTRLAAAAMLVVSAFTAAPAYAVSGLQRVVDAIASSGGRYVAGGASLKGADCSGLVSVAQSLATGKPVHRYGNTGSLLAGRWADVIPGAEPGDRFIIATNRRHMVAQLDGVGVEARQTGEGFRIGPDAASVWDPQFTKRFHLPERLLIA